MKELKGDGSYRFTLIVDGDDLKVIGVKTTWFGGPNDPNDEGPTSSGVNTRDEPDIIGCGLPMDLSIAGPANSNPHKYNPTAGSPLPRIPWRTPVTVTNPENGATLDVPLIDLGPNKSADSDAGFDLTPAAFSALGGKADFKKNSGDMIVNYVIRGGAAFLPAEMRDGAAAPATPGAAGAASEAAGGLTTGDAPPYPDHVIQLDDAETAVVKLIQHRLNAWGCGPLDEDGEFGAATDAAVRKFQARHSDADGDQLISDGQVGLITWEALFGKAAHATAPVVQGPAPATGGSALLAKLLEVASSQVGVREHPLGSNRGTEVEAYQDAAGVAHGDPWCVAFEYWCFMQASRAAGVTNPMLKRGSVLALWNDERKRKTPVVTTEQAVNNPSRVKAGMLFIIDTGGGDGHTGIVVSTAGGKLVTIEGNTNDSGSREGIGVFRKDTRRINSINRGFIDYGLA